MADYFFVWVLSIILLCVSFDLILTNEGYILGIIFLFLSLLLFSLSIKAGRIESEKD